MSVRILHYSDIENAYDDPGRIGRLAGRIEERRDETTVVVGSGDDTAPGVLSLVTKGQQALDFYGAIEPDVETFGNHDFDYGLSPARDVVAASPQTWVTANVTTDGQRFGRDVGTEPWTIVEADGTRVGFTGVTTPRTPETNPAATDLDVLDPVAATDRAIEQLRARDVDHVVVLSHLGRGDEALARSVDADAILGGHVPTERADRIDGTLLARPGDGGSVLLEVEFHSEPTVTRHPVADAPIDDDVAAALRTRMQSTGLDEVVGTVAEPIERSESAVFGGESRIGNFVADAYRWATDADVGLQNSGGIRTGSPLYGEVTVADLVGVVPFEESIGVARLSGAELLTLCEQAAASDLDFAEPDWWHAHFSGVELVADPLTGAVESLSVGGEPVDPGATYAIATTEYLFQTSAEFPVLEADHREETVETQYDILVSFARQRGIDPSIEERIRFVE